MNRRKSRETAMKLLFQMTVNKEELADVISTHRENIDDGASEAGAELGIRKEVDPEDMDMNDVDMTYVTELIRGTLDNQEQVDEAIRKNLKNWKLERLSKVDLTILRISTYELMFDDEIPPVVCINEAVELSKTYSDEKSSAFINGVLDKIYKNR